MKRAKMQRVLAFMLASVMMFTSTGITALASNGGADANTKSTGINPSPGNGGYTDATTTLHLDGGGYKISILELEANTYKPTERGTSPIYGESDGMAISVNGTTIPKDTTRYGYASMYSVGSLWDTRSKPQSENWKLSN